jgi:hypothetical protein
MHDGRHRAGGKTLARQDCDPKALAHVPIGFIAA